MLGFLPAFRSANGIDHGRSSKASNADGAVEFSQFRLRTDASLSAGSGCRYLERMQNIESVAPVVRVSEVSWTLMPREARILLCRTPAGFPSPAQDDMEEPIDLGAWLVEQPAASYIMRVDGHSMAGAGINDGDLVVVSRAAKARAGSIVVALVHGDRTLKRLRKMDGRFWLVPEAEGYPHTIVDESVEIWGVVVGLARRYP